MEYAADKADIFVTATGNHNIIRYEHMAKMKPESIVCNIGHFDNESMSLRSSKSASGKRSNPRSIT